MDKPHTLLISGLLLFTSAQAHTFYAVRNGDWMQPTTWMSRDGGTGYPSGADEARIGGATGSGVTLARTVTVTIAAGEQIVMTTGAVTVEQQSTLNVLGELTTGSGLLAVGPGCTLNNVGGALFLRGSVQNLGTINNSVGPGVAPGSNNTPGFITSSGAFTNGPHGVLNNNYTTSFYNTGSGVLTIDATATVTNAAGYHNGGGYVRDGIQPVGGIVNLATIADSGTLTNTAGGWIYNSSPDANGPAATGTLTVLAGGVLNNSGIVGLPVQPAAGTVKNYGTINNNAGSLSGTIVNGQPTPASSGSVTVYIPSATLNNASGANILGSLTNNDRGVFNNRSTGDGTNNGVGLSGTIVNAGGQINNVSGSLGSISNQGGTVRNSGTVAAPGTLRNAITNTSVKMAGGPAKVGVLTNDVGGAIIEGATLVNGAGAIFNNAGAVGPNSTDRVSLANSGTVNNSGTIVLEIPSSNIPPDGVINDAPISNTGSGSLTIATLFNNAGHIWNVGLSTLITNNGVVTNTGKICPNTPAQLKGTGTITGNPPSCP